MVIRLTFVLFISLSMLGCNEPVQVIEPPPPTKHEVRIDGNVTFQGEISWSDKDNSIDTHIWAENTGTDSVRIKTGPCAFNIIAYNENREPVWYNRTIEKAVCSDEMLVYTIPPGGSSQLTGQSYISGDQWYHLLPAGDWSFKARAFTAEGDTVVFELN